MIKQTREPDFGFDVVTGEQPIGWDLFLDLIQSSEKFERVQNFIHSRIYDQDKVSKLREKEKLRMER